MGYKKPGVDLGIAISGALLRPGECRTCEAIAAFAGCSKQNIEQLENRALKKLRHKVLFTPEIREILADFLTTDRRIIGGADACHHILNPMIHQ